MTMPGFGGFGGFRGVGGVIKGGQVKSNGLRTNTNKQATHSNNPVPQTAQHNSPSSFSNYPLIFLICRKFWQILVPTFSFFLSSFFFPE